MTHISKRAVLSVGSLGGTVSMQAAAPGQGVTPTLDCLGLLAVVPQLAELAELRTATLCLLPSASLGFAQLFEVLAWAQAEVEQGAQAVVITQGTDTLEETAYFLHLLWSSPTPLVLTGAMRSASQPGADGPANLLAAAQVGLAASSRGRGVLVVINDEIHSAAKVRKVASLAMAAFASPGDGCDGYLLEGKPVYRQPGAARSVLPLPTNRGHTVALLEASLDADTGLLEALPKLGYAGLVVAGFGAGHVSASWAEALQRIAEQIPVVIATRTGSGPTATATYGFVGGEIDLRSKRMLMAGRLCPRKCRILLWLLLGCGLEQALEEHLGQY
ncbi:L-asparaginase [Pseudomonas sp. BIGb0278]|uniref:Putative L-asparaginase n=1 Tax=Pseudomonas fluorescens TaxID=294 RepID=A0A5E6USE2_PSEFL|nr:MULTISPECIES: asparaginase [Pseudomonas]MCS4286289.1 L-asparaginase [Pseudomonas sp. BIGb0278]VVN08540.1 putative L-asparaginase [Pseudomonas fluorescens]